MARPRRSQCSTGCRQTLPDERAFLNQDPSLTGRGDLSPIILTAQMAPADQAWADGLRRRYFPPDRNQLAAHITLFHHLPPGCLSELQHVLVELARGPRPRARIDRLLSLGNGVAFHVDSPELLAMREEIAERFAPLLTPQDAGRPRLHITVQNKVAVAEARATLTELEHGFTPRPLAIKGLELWYYRGGPWSPIRRHAFRG